MSGRVGGCGDGRQAGERDVLSRLAGSRFVRDAEDDDGSWEKRLAKKYYDKLFKEYCLADMSR
jgi:protein FRA10AC1